MDNSTQEIITAYVRLVSESDRLPPHDIRPALMGLFGEIGGVLTAAKKLVREDKAYSSFRADAKEDLGDALWYLAASARRLGIPLQELLKNAKVGKPSTIERLDDLEDELIELIGSAARLSAHQSDSEVRSLIHDFADKYVKSIQRLGLPIERVIETNSRKVSGRFLPLSFSELPTFDHDYDEDERLPSNFEFSVKERKSGHTYISLNGVFIGDPLTDNMAEADGYRFHDVFHMANAAVLHWSPVLRSLLKRKRKSNSAIDGSEDSGRAIVVEEGLSAWIFSRAKQQNLFDGADKISFDILKIISEFVRGYEVDQCPQALWERSILQGYAAFRQLQASGSGVIIGNRENRTISFRRTP